MTSSPVMVATEPVRTSLDVPAVVRPKLRPVTDHRVRNVATIGFVACVAVMAGSAMRGWPFPNLTAEPWLYQLTTTSTAVRYLFLTLFFAGVGGMCWSWIRLYGLAREGRLSVKATFGIFALWSIPIMLAVPLFSGDVYVYYVDGQAMDRGFNPYSAGVSAMGPVPNVFMVHPVWRATPSMYGPLFVRTAETIAHVTASNVIAGVIIFRLLAVSSIALMGVAIVKLARSVGRPATTGLVFALLNPLTMLHLVGGAHNDSMMLALLLGGLAVGISARTWPIRFLAIALCVAGAAFKVPAFAGVLILGWVWEERNPPSGGAWPARRSRASSGCWFSKVFTSQPA